MVRKNKLKNSIKKIQYKNFIDSNVKIISIDHGGGDSSQKDISYTVRTLQL